MRYLFILTISFFLVACGSGEHSQADHQDMQDQDKGHSGQMQQTDEQLIYYTCPMEEHKQVHSAEPGKCSECNMELVAGVVTGEGQMEYYGCPMLTHSHVRSDSAGTCADCGMGLKPMRLKKEI